MKIALSLASFIVLLGMNAAVMADAGGSCHFHGAKPASESTVIQCPNQRKTKLVDASKLEKSWAPIQHESISLIEGKKQKEWKVVYQNPMAASPDKKTLYLFFTATGNFIAANHTGQ